MDNVDNCSWIITKFTIKPFYSEAAIYYILNLIEGLGIKLKMLILLFILN